MNCWNFEKCVFLLLALLKVLFSLVIEFSYVFIVLKKLPFWLFFGKSNLNFWKFQRKILHIFGPFKFYFLGHLIFISIFVVNKISFLTFWGSNIRNFQKYFSAHVKGLFAWSLYFLKYLFLEKMIFLLFWGVNFELKFNNMCFC